MSIEQLPSKPFLLEVHSVEIYRMHSGPDRVILKTNMPNPCHPYTGTLIVKLDVTRGKGPMWVEQNLPGIEVELWDAQAMRARPHISLSKKQA